MKPDDIPQGVWDDAMTTWNAANSASIGRAKMAVQIIARAIMAATAEERKACADLARNRWKSWGHSTANELTGIDKASCRDIAAAIERRT